ncbi:methyltransferase TRM13-domain-containing protein [Gamsiella multidivaricata]|uniref:methyltransferase TRM13-domain-containing protein n=1 Tax=Gamsiella multidivaricata TaxID=101098 RepID=UPI0022210FDF|nr:methyltransferase TRM13-domain-containing protein [Gamsiella multidivaricata]KAG0369444.1 hypothetical protein BGZ54_009950 [Gamsiella multidivaricata]KAI7821390.1 methyltransferase TRM13-domain-containing protein [Gamsiella multidivaricata]
MQLHPIICQHSVWGSKQQRFRHCKLPAKLTASLLEQIKALEEQCFQAVSGTGVQNLTEEDRQQQSSRFLSLRTELLQPEYEAKNILCGHHRKEAHLAQAALNQIEKEKAAGIYQDPEELRQLAKEQPVNPSDIPEALLAALERVFSNEPSAWIKQVLDQWDGPDEWKAGRGDREANEIREVAVEHEFPCHESYEGLFADAGVKKKRHLAQESQLIQAMASMGLLKPVLEPQHCNIDSSNKIAEVAAEPMNHIRRPVFVEFGAGTGGLSRHVQLVLESEVCKRAVIPSTSSTPSTRIDPQSTCTSTAVISAETSIEPFNFVLLDRQRFRSRNQVDYMIRTQARPVKPRLLRIIKDVRDLTLQNLQFIHETEPGIARPEWTESGGEVDPQEASTAIPTHYICISKHFCGPATDLALAWMREQKQQGPKESSQQDSYSICFATCCHGICEPSLVVAKPYLLELLSAAGIKKRKRVESEHGHDLGGSIQNNSQREQEQQEWQVSEEQLDSWIPWIIKLTGWATLGKQEESSLVARPGKDSPTTSGANGNGEDVMTRDQRRVLGKRCKKLLDMARCMYLIHECGFKEARAIEYTAESVESGAIVGTM